PPRTRRCRGVPRADEFGGFEREAVCRPGPPAVLAGALHPGGGADPKSVTGHLGPRRFTVSEPRLAAPFVVLDIHRPTIGRLEVDDVQFAVGVGGAEALLEVGRAHV